MQVYINKNDAEHVKEKVGVPAESMVILEVPSVLILPITRIVKTFCVGLPPVSKRGRNILARNETKWKWEFVKGRLVTV